MPLKVNGDDIAFRSTQEEADKWMQCVSQSGLTLSKGKTLVHPAFFSINSTFFRASPEKVKLIPVVRWTTVLFKPNSQLALRDRLKAASWGWYGKRRRTILSFMLRYHRATAVKGWVSWTRGYGVPGVNEEVLVSADLLRREAMCLGRPANVDRPIREYVSFDNDEPSLGDSPGKRDVEDFVQGGFVKRRVRDLCKSCIHHQRGLVTEYHVMRSWRDAFVERKKVRSRDFVSVVRTNVGARMLGMTRAQYKHFFWSGVTRTRFWDWVWGREVRVRRPAETLVKVEELCFRCEPPSMEECRPRPAYVVREDMRQFVSAAYDWAMFVYASRGMVGRKIVFVSGRK
jgi:hypothetical protein